MSPPNSPLSQLPSSDRSRPQTARRLHLCDRAFDEIGSDLVAGVSIDARLPGFPFPRNIPTLFAIRFPRSSWLRPRLLTSPRRGCPHRRGSRCHQSQLQRNPKLQREVPLVPNSSRSSQVPRRSLEVGESSRLRQSISNLISVVYL